MTALSVFAPIDGTLLPLQQVPDPAFAEQMLGDGIAVNPTSSCLVAPIDGQITHIHPAKHAITIKQGNIEILIHVGIDTVQLKGQGFELQVKANQKVTKGQPLLHLDLELIQKHTSCSWIIMVVTSPIAASLQKKQTSQVRAGKDEVFTLTEEAVAQKDTAQEWIYSEEIRIQHENGLHARPAALLAQTAKNFSFALQIEHKNQYADLKSLVAVMGLAIGKGERVRLRAAAHAPQADQALAQLIALLQNVKIQEEAPLPKPPIHKPSSTAYSTLSYPGVTVCPGAVYAPLCHWHTPEITYASKAANPAEEKEKLNKALSSLQDYYQKKASSPQEKSLVQAHINFLQDPFVLEKAVRFIDQGYSAPAAFQAGVHAAKEILQQAHDPFFAERSEDLEDICRQILHLLTEHATPSQTSSLRGILVAKELLPSEVLGLPDTLQGVVLARGSLTSHASILLRNKGIPTMIQAGENICRLPAKTPAILNATAGVLIAQPSDQELTKFKVLLHTQQAARQQNLQTAKQSASTTDGTAIHITGNASTPQEAEACLQNGADGLGLVRTEFLFHGQAQAPTEEQQYQHYCQTAAALKGAPITLRTFDVGGDKPISYMPVPKEANPFLGIRGVRTYALYPDIFLTQIRAMLRTAQIHPIQIMLPMVTTPDEMQQYRQLIELEKQKLGITRPVPIGMMVEVPSAALLAEQFAPLADFFSIGTNDLTQYTLAIDRGHTDLASHSDPLNPAVLQLISLTCQAAHKHKRPVAVCGAVAADPTAVPLLIGLGVQELAVGASAIADIKANVQKITFDVAKQAAQHALSLETSAQVRAYVHQEFPQLF